MTARRLLLPVFLIDAGTWRLASGSREAKLSQVTARRAALDAEATSGTIAARKDGRALHRTA
jgi:hypothetical protein